MIYTPENDPPIEAKKEFSHRRVVSEVESMNTDLHRSPES